MEVLVILQWKLFERGFISEYESLSLPPSLSLRWHFWVLTTRDVWNRNFFHHAFEREREESLRQGTDDCTRHQRKDFHEFPSSVLRHFWGHGLRKTTFAVKISPVFALFCYKQTHKVPSQLLRQKVFRTCPSKSMLARAPVHCYSSWMCSVEACCVVSSSVCVCVCVCVCVI